MRHLLQKKWWQTALILHLPVLVFCQVITFKKSLSSISHSFANCVVETEKGYIIGGVVNGPNNNSNADAYLISVDKTGQLIWGKNYGGMAKQGFSSVAVANEQDGYVAYGSDGNLGSQQNSWIIKVDTLGNTLWENRIGLNLNREVPNASIVTLNDGYIVSSKVDRNLSNIYFGSSVVKVSNDGNIVWSKTYIFNDNQDSSSLKDYGIRFAKDSILYGSGTNGTNAVYFTANSVNGNLVSAVEYSHQDYSLSCPDLLKAPDGNFFLTGYIIESNIPNTPSAQKWIWIAKINPSGQIIWSKTLPPSFLWYYTPRKWVVTDDGGIVGCATEKRSASPLDYDNMVALKVDSQGNNTLKKAIPIKYYNEQQYAADLIQTSDGGFLLAGEYYGDDSVRLVSSLIKTDSYLEVSDCCSKNRENIPSEIFNVVSVPALFTQTDYVAFAPTALVPLFSPNFIVSDICLTPQPRVTRTVQFCPGDTVWVAGTPYTQADTLYDVRLVSADDCDTLATYILQYSSDGYVSNLSLQCPDNIVLLAPVGANALPVSFTEPLATTDCPCPNLTNNQISGFSNGDLFPLGTTAVCYRSADDCGNTSTCCFDVKVESQVIPEEYCDEKISGCARFELAQVTRNSTGQWIYRIHLTNLCADPVRYAYFQVPDGVQSVEPTTGSEYIAPSGSTFTVRNPNFSPFYSIRFQPQNTNSLANGQSETFRYVLPPQASVTHIHAAIRLASGAFVETHLNTFACDVGTEQKGSILGLSERGAETDNYSEIMVFPNPISAGRTLNILNVEAEDVTFSLYDVTGRLLWVQPVFGGQVQFEEASNGIYFFKIREKGQSFYSGKVTVLHP